MNPARWNVESVKYYLLYAEEEDRIARFEDKISPSSLGISGSMDAMHEGTWTAEWAEGERV